MRLQRSPPESNTLHSSSARSLEIGWLVADNEAPGGIDGKSVQKVKNSAGLRFALVAYGSIAFVPLKFDRRATSGDFLAKCLAG
jgi:hypothetical protein